MDGARSRGGPGGEGGGFHRDKARESSISRKLGGVMRGRGEGWWLFCRQGSSAAQRGSEYVGEERYQKTSSGRKFGSLKRGGFQEIA